MATVTIDRTAQRFSSDVQPEPDVCCIHTTEGTSWPGYSGGGAAPHATIRPLPGVGIQVREHIPFSQYAKALMNLPGGVQTNRRGVVQFELMGTCDPKHRGQAGWYYWPDADDVVLEALANYLRPILTTYGIPFTALPFLAYPASYGNRQGQRLSYAAWNAYNGILGHQHVPENDHGDPGAFPGAKLVKFLVAGRPATSPASSIPKVFQQVKAVLTGRLIVDGNMGPATIKRWQQIMHTPADGKISRPSSLILAVQRTTGVHRDGLLGPATWKSIQRRIGVTADGVPGPVTIKALQRRLNTGKF